MNVTKTMHCVSKHRTKHVAAVFRSYVTLEGTCGTSPCTEVVKEVTAENQFEKLADVVTPLWRVPYNSQLEQKFMWTKHIVKNINNKLIKKQKGKYVDKFVKPHIEAVKPSPITEEYRNKDELNIRHGVDGNPKTLGFFLGSTARNDVVCIPPTHLINVKSSHKKVMQAFQEVIRKSKLDACHDLGPGGGHWRQLLVRSNESDQLMAIAVLHPQSLSKDQLNEEKQLLYEYFVSGPGASCNLHSLYFQACPQTRCTHEKAPFELLHGEPHITEEIAGYKFRISPDSFFQVNTRAAEILYSYLLKLADLSPYSTVLDICCGTGIISILASKHARGCVGIEAISDAIRDAQFNAKVNNIYNVHFFSGLVEKRLNHILEELNMASEIVPILNPGRAGVGSKVIRKINECCQVNKCIYVSCKADNPNTTDNFAQLCEEGGFTLKRIIPVDLFPHTFYTELIMLFVR